MLRNLPNIGGIIPHVRGVFPHVRGISPHVGGVSPHVGESFPHVGGGSPHVGGGSPHVGEYLPYVGEHLPHVGGSFPQLRERSYKLFIILFNFYTHFSSFARYRPDIDFPVVSRHARTYVFQPCASYNSAGIKPRSVVMYGKRHQAVIHH